MTRWAGRMMLLHLTSAQLNQLDRLDYVLGTLSLAQGIAVVVVGRRRLLSGQGRMPVRHPLVLATIIFSTLSIAFGVWQLINP